MSDDAFNETCVRLLSLGWTEGRDQFKSYARMFYKRHDTATRCSGNEDKAGAQILLYVSELQGHVSIEMDLCGGLPDETWIRLSNYSLPKDVNEVIRMVPRMLATWEAAASHKEDTK